MADVEEQSPAALATVEEPTADEVTEELPSEEVPASDGTEPAQGVGEETSAPSPAKKTSVPPKRPITTAKRVAGSGTTSAPKGTPASTARAVPGSGLTKPPTRPPPGSTIRRTAGTATGPTASSGHKSHPSTSSTDNDKKPLGGTAKRMSLAGTGSGTARSPVTKPASTADRRSSLNPSTSTVRKPLSNNNSPSKPSTTSATAVSRGPPSTTTRVREAANSTKTAATGAVADARKRLSAISSSPAPKTTARSTTGVSATSKDPSALRDRVHELEAEVQTLKEGHAATETTNGETARDMEAEIESLKGRAEASDARVSPSSLLTIIPL